MKRLSKNSKDCKNCANCEGLRGFMCICRYSYDDENGHHQFGQDVHRTAAAKCEYYAEESGSRDKVFVM